MKGGENMGCENRLAFSFTTLRRNEAFINDALITDRNLAGLEFEVSDVVPKFDSQDKIRVSGECGESQELPLLKSLVRISLTAFSPVEFEDLSKRVSCGEATIRQIHLRTVYSVLDNGGVVED